VASDAAEVAEPKDRTVLDGLLDSVDTSGECELLQGPEQPAAEVKKGRRSSLAMVVSTLSMVRSKKSSTATGSDDIPARPSNEQHGASSGPFENEKRSVRRSSAVFAAVLGGRNIASAGAEAGPDGAAKGLRRERRRESVKRLVRNSVASAEEVEKATLELERANFAALEAGRAMRLAQAVATRQQWENRALRFLADGNARLKDGTMLKEWLEVQEELKQAEHAGVPLSDAARSALVRMNTAEKAIKQASAAAIRAAEAAAAEFAKSKEGARHKARSMVMQDKAEEADSAASRAAKLVEEANILAKQVQQKAKAKDDALERLKEAKRLEYQARWGWASTQLGRLSSRSPKDPWGGSNGGSDRAITAGASLTATTTDRDKDDDKSHIGCFELLWACMAPPPRERVLPSPKRPLTSVPPTGQRTRVPARVQ
jgi:hypothetical protein